MHCTWSVVYKDGSTLHQYDKISPAYDKAAEEVPYRAINWPSVKSLKLASQLCEANWDIAPPPEGISVSLRSRTFMTMTRDEVQCMMLVLAEADKPVSAETAKSILYWFPDGVQHECENFNCPDVGNYGHAFIRREQAALMPATKTLTTEFTAEAV